MLIRAAKQPLGAVPDPTLGWDGLIEGNFEIVEAPGHPTGLLSEPRLRFVAKQIRDRLWRAQGEVAERQSSDDRSLLSVMNQTQTR